MKSETLGGLCKFLKANLGCMDEPSLRRLTCTFRWRGLHSSTWAYVSLRQKADGKPWNLQTADVKRLCVISLPVQYVAVYILGHDLKQPF